MALAPTSRSNDLSSQGVVSQMGGTLSNFMVIVRQPAIQRALPAIIIVAVGILGLLAWTLLSEPAKKALYPGVSEAEKSQMVDVLTGNGITATINTSTGDVEVPNGDYYRARMALAAAGLPQTVPASQSALADVPMGTSRSVETARLRQAQEMELSRSIAEIATVTGARVHLALPERTAFLRETAPPRASVFLQLAAGRTLDRGQVDAIVNLVSSSVPGMARADVSVVDQMGRLLSRGSDDPALAVSDRELEHRIQLESLYQNRIKALLAPIAGAENISVQVNVDMDFTRSETTQEIVDPNATVVLSEQEQLTESMNGPARGIPGTIANTPPQQPVMTDTETLDTIDGNEIGPATSNLSNRSSSSTRNYEVSRTVTATQRPSARVERISAAVLVRAASEDGAGLPPVEDLESLVASAIGFKAERGDSITIQAQPFVTSDIPAVSPISSMTWLPEVIRQLAIVAILAVIAFGVVRPLLDRILVPIGQSLSDSSRLSAAAVEVGEGESLDDVQARLHGRRIQLTENAIAPGASREAKYEAIRQIAHDDPARIASVLHRMMAHEVEEVN